MSAHDRNRSERFAKDFLAAASAIVDQRPVPVGREGIVVSGSWDAKSGTVEVLFGDTYAALDDSEIILHPRLPVLTTQLGDQYAPVGGERCIMLPIQSGFAVLIHHGEDDSPGAPSGERWITHRGASGSPTAALKLTNDALTPGDGLGAFQGTGGGYASILAPLVELGVAGADADLDAVVRVRDLIPLINLLNTHTHGGVQSGPSSTANPNQTFTDPTGSTHTKAKD